MEKTVEDGLCGIVIDKDTDRRDRLRHVVRYMDVFDKFIPTATLDMAVANIESSDELDVIFISDTFIEDLPRLRDKLDEHGKKTLIVMVTQTTQGEADVAEKLLRGVSAVLAEPYSADTLASVCDLAFELRQQERERRNHEAMERLVRTVLTALDEVASKMATFKPYGPARRRMVQTSKIIGKLEPEQRELYFKILDECTERAMAPVESPRIAAEAQRREQEKRCAKLLEKLQQQAKTVRIIKKP